MIKKIFCILLLIIILLVGGVFVFLQTKSDFILEQVSGIVEDATGAPLHMEALPSLTFFPSPSVTLGSASWGRPELSVKFQSARVHFSFTELFKGNFSLAEVAFVGLDFVYDSVAIQKQEHDTPQKEPSTNEVATSATSEASVKSETSVAGTEEATLASTIENAFKFIPQNISLTDSSIHYNDATQTLILTNLNTEIRDLALNSKSSMSLKSLVQYISESSSQNLELTCDTSLSFILATNAISFDLSHLEIQPVKGLAFTQSVSAEAKAEMILVPLDVYKLSASLKSPFGETQITQVGELNKDGLVADINATVYPRLIVQSFAPETSLPSTKDMDTVNFSTKLAYTEDTLSIQNFESTLGDATIKTSVAYNKKLDSLTGDISLANFVLDAFLEMSKSTTHATEETGGAGEGKENAQATTAEASSQSTKLELPSAFQKTSFDIALQLDQITYDTLTLQSSSSKLQGKNSALSLNDLKLKMLGTDISGKVTMDLGNAQSMGVNVNIPSLDINTWNKAFTGSSGLAGTAVINSKLTFPVANPMANLNGSGQIDLTNLKVESNVLPAVAKILVASKVTDHYFEFADGKIPFTLDKSVLTLNKAYLNSDKYYITASGTANLITEALNLNAEGGKGVNSTLTIPVSIKGSMSDPKVTISLKDSANIVTHILDSTIKTDLGGSSDSLNEKINQGINSGLNKLFGN